MRVLNIYTSSGIAPAEKWQGCVQQKNKLKLQDGLVDIQGFMLLLVEKSGGKKLSWASSLKADDSHSIQPLL